MMQQKWSTSSLPLGDFVLFVRLAEAQQVTPKIFPHDALIKQLKSLPKTKNSDGNSYQKYGALFVMKRMDNIEEKC